MPTEWKASVVDVTVCTSSSWLIHVTTLPGATVIVAGLYSWALISTCGPAVSADGGTNIAAPASTALTRLARAKERHGDFVRVTSGPIMSDLPLSWMRRANPSRLRFVRLSNASRLPTPAAIVRSRRSKKIRASSRAGRPPAPRGERTAAGDVMAGEGAARGGVDRQQRNRYRPGVPWWRHGRGRRR